MKKGRRNPRDPDPVVAVAENPGDRLAVVPKPQEIGLFLDVDGTLLDLAPHPEAVEVSSLLIDTLAAAERRLGGALALVTGRPIAALDRLFAPLKLRAAGVHGAEMRLAPDGITTLPAERRMPPQAWAALCRLLRRFPGTFAEDKHASFAVHYRESGGDARELAAALSGFIAHFAAFALELVPGRRVFEIRRPGFDKGKAIEIFMAEAPFHGRRPVFIADDEMDRPGFDAVLAQGGLAYSVGRALPGLCGSFPEPAAVRAWLAEIGR